LKLLKELCETPGVPGREEKLREIVRRELEGIVDEMRVDALGNLICIKRARGKKKLMIASHMDEIGFVASYIDEAGFIRIVPLGGHDPRNMVAQRVRVQGKRELIGLLYPGQKPPHILTEEERKQLPKMSDFFVDVGLPAEVVKELVPIGSPVTLLRDFIEIGEAVSCKAMDNRLALYIMIEAMRRAKRFAFEIYAVATTQEEVGLRGAEVSAFGVEPGGALGCRATLICSRTAPDSASCT